ncbi:AMP-binding protein [Sphingomonas sp.]|uniref:AMP-binding protein n=1 Tax=Sphingomonas sp. TaxID=28214 RepID=UPI002DD678DA|nr:AMP-binding protein [Sphingomonas sp.]
MTDQQLAPGDGAPSFFAALAASLRTAGDRMVLTEAGRSLTGNELSSEIDRWAAALSALGVRPGDRVAAQAEKSLALALVYLATLRLGAVFLPLNPAYRADEVAYFLDDAEPRLLVADPGAVPARAGLTIMTLDAGGGGTLADAVARADNPAPPPHAASPDDLAVIVYTSGTTGRAKGAMITHRNLLVNARALIATWGIGADDVLLHALPLFHIHGLFIALNTLLLAGGRIDLLPGFDAATVVDRLPGATLFMGVPTYYTRLLAAPAFDRATANSIRLFVCGSAPLTPATFAAFEARTGQRILERYGMSECGIICSNPLDGDRVAGAVGRPLPGYQVRIADAAPVGVLEVRGDSVFAGYWRQPDKTRAEFRDDGFFVTGDIATIDATGVVRIVGRDKDMIISGGLNVYPKEIEERIDAIDGVVESAVVGVPHADFGEAVVAVVHAVPDAALSADAILARLRPVLAAFKLPKAVFLVDALPRNTMGKVERNVLRARYDALWAGDA